MDGVETIAGWVTVLIVDRVGRRVLLIPGCGMGASTLIAAGVVLKYETMGHLTLAKGSAAATIILVRHTHVPPMFFSCAAAEAISFHTNAVVPRHCPIASCCWLL